MLVKICDICGEIIDTNNYVYIKEGFFRNKEKYGDNQMRQFYESDICMKCARTYNVMQFVESIRMSTSNV